MKRWLILLAILSGVAAQELEFIWAEDCPSCETSCPNMSKVMTPAGVCYNIGFMATTFTIESILVTSCTVRDEFNMWNATLKLFNESDCTGTFLMDVNETEDGTYICDVGTSSAILYGCFEVSPPPPSPTPSGPSDSTIMAIIFLPLAIAAVVIMLLLRVAPDTQRARSF